MNEQERQAEVERVRALASNKQHIRKHALRLAGQYLSQVGDNIAEAEINRLEEEILEDEELFQANENLIEQIADEVERIGKELTNQSGQKAESTNG
jgi:hypothetical protein